MEGDGRCAGGLPEEGSLCSSGPSGGMPALSSCNDCSNQEASREGIWFRFSGSGLGFWGSVFGVWGPASCLGVEVQCSAFRDWGLGVTVALEDANMPTSDLVSNI